MAEVSKVAGIDKLNLVLTVIFAVIFLGDTLSWKTAVGAGLNSGWNFVSDLEIESLQ